ncbi:MAG: AsnC family transcriptional regulator [Armatimonadota bacterium]|nr:AsnC family transcriptional regulator [Armatimonadota bacterium]MDR7465401.1 AsnC family transcriptional regulator [Armatimonadota bacterium]
MTRRDSECRWPRGRNSTGWLTNSEIGRRLGLAEGTIRRRIERMLVDGIVRIAAVANPFKIGLPIVAFIGIEVDPSAGGGCPPSGAVWWRCSRWGRW